MSQKPTRPSGRKNGTVLRTFRLPQPLSLALELEAKTMGISPNALVSMIITRFVDWDRYAARFGYVGVSRETLRSLLDLTDEEELSAAARRVGAEVPRDAVLFWFKKISVNTFLSYLEYVCKFGRHAEYECQASAGDYTVTLRHDLGMRWSIWLRHSLDEALRKMLSIIGQFELSESEVILRFNAPLGMKPTGASAD